MTIRAVAATVALALAATATGCGVPADDEALEIAPPRTLHQAGVSPSPTHSDSGPVEEKLFLVKDGSLVAVIRRVPAEPTIDTLVRDLLSGPTGAERDRGLSSALLGSDVVAGVRLTGGRAIVELTSILDGTGRNDEVLAFAQLVCTLTARRDTSGAIFIRGGQRVGVPRGDGSLSTGPLTVADYMTLIADG